MDTTNNNNRDMDVETDTDIAVDIDIDDTIKDESNTTAAVCSSTRDIHMEEEEASKARHEIPLRLLSIEEEFVVNDVLGVTNSPHPNIEHIRVPHANDSVGDMKMLHSTSRGDSFSMKKPKSGSSLHAIGGSNSHLSKENLKKKVGFAPEPPKYSGHHGHGNASNFGIKKDPVHLDSTDGLIVASVFLPVHLHRSPTGQWSADWDYEALLSMQTHLRVTRVGVVKWRGWHGNKGADGSPEGGVPKEEWYLVEECLRPMNCVPVWVEPSLFGEM
jgi:hypothetical protein